MSFSEKFAVVDSIKEFLRINRIVILIGILAVIISAVLWLRLSTQTENQNQMKPARGYKPHTYASPAKKTLSLDPWGVDPFLDPVRDEEIQRKKNLEREKIERELHEKEEKERFEREESERQRLEAERVAAAEAKKRQDEFSTYAKNLVIMGIVCNPHGVSSAIIGQDTYLEGSDVEVGKFRAVLKKVDPSFVILTFERQDYQIPVLK